MTRLPQSTQRVVVAAIDDILGTPYQVLGDGFVRAVDYMGGDESIVQAARVSYGRGTKKVQADQALIRYLMRHRHTTPFEMCEIKFHVRVPMDCWRQWIRHRTANVNEYSTRYSKAIDAAQKTAQVSWRTQSPSNRQGSAGVLQEDIGKRLSEREDELQAFSRTVYEERLNAGVAREQARKDLPLSTYTEAYWKIDLHNLFHFLSLRMDEHAQVEIRSYANTIGHEMVRRWCPIAWQAFLDYRPGSVSLSRLERDILVNIAAGKNSTAKELAQSYGWLKFDGQKLKRNREREECEAKLHSLGFGTPW